jgi:hypothetical protein
MSEEIIKNKYLDLSGLQKYDELIKNYIKSGNDELSDVIAALNAKIGNMEDIYGSDDKTLVEIIEGIYSSIADIILTEESLVEKDAKLEEKINEIIGDLDSLEGSDGVMSLVDVSNKLNNLEDSVAKNTAAIEVLNGDGEGSLKKAAADAAAEAIAAVVAGAESDFDTLKEVAEWIAADTLGAAELQITVSNHTDSIKTINNDLDDLEAKVDQDITNLTNHMSEASQTLTEYDSRIDVLESFVETHGSIEDSDIEALFS